MLYEFTFSSLTGFLMHADDVMEGDHLGDWRGDPKNSSVSVRGDDRSPPWTWQTYLYSDGEHLVIPQENIMACLRKAGERIKNPSRKNSNLKELSQTGLCVTSESCDFFKDRECRRRVPIAPIVEMRNLSFAQQFQETKKLGFELKVKRAKLASSKNIRVRALFRSWSIRGAIEANDPLFDADDARMLRELFRIAGHSIGLGDWRPNSPKSPGPYGRFVVHLKAAAAPRSA